MDKEFWFSAGVVIGGALVLVAWIYTLNIRTEPIKPELKFPKSQMFETGFFDGSIDVGVSYKTKRGDEYKRVVLRGKLDLSPLGDTYSVMLDYISIGIEEGTASLDLYDVNIARKLMGYE